MISNLDLPGRRDSAAVSGTYDLGSTQIKSKDGWGHFKVCYHHRRNGQDILLLCLVHMIWEGPVLREFSRSRAWIPETSEMYEIAAGARAGE